MKRSGTIGAGILLMAGGMGLIATGDPEAPDRVSPGLVRWHASPDDALTAARASGKPVLHFLLLGRLDDEFC